MSQSPSKTILVVDDDDELRDSVIMLLELSGFIARAAANGREALEAIAGGKPDLILLDMRMPIMDGREFARRFHETYGNSLPIIVLTAAEDARRSAQEIGASCAIGKPFDAASLIAEIHRRI